MPKPLDETWVRGNLADLIRSGPDGDEIVLDEREQDGGTITVSVPVGAFVEMFGGVDVDPTSSRAAHARDRMKAADANADGTAKGYADIFDRWHTEGRFAG